MKGLFFLLLITIFAISFSSASNCTNYYPCSAKPDLLVNQSVCDFQGDQQVRVTCLPNSCDVMYDTTCNIKYPNSFVCKTTSDCISGYCENNLCQDPKNSLVKWGIAFTIVFLLIWFSPKIIKYIKKKLRKH